jgi:hypothetical protein
MWCAQPNIIRAHAAETMQFAHFLLIQFLAPHVCLEKIAELEGGE